MGDCCRTQVLHSGFPPSAACPHACPSPLLLVQVIDRVGFIMNNITMQNIDTKIRDLNNHVKPEFHPWFANYLVVKRAAQVGCMFLGGASGWVSGIVPPDKSLPVALTIPRGLPGRRLSGRVVGSSMGGILPPQCLALLAVHSPPCMLVCWH